MTHHKPLISLIAAMAADRVIGRDNQMPWHLPADLKHFKTVTMDKPVIMGRKTFQSIGRPLPGRKNIVISSSNFQAEGVETVASIEQALVLVSNVAEIMIIGGGFLYQQMLPMADKLYLTFIQAEIEGDTRFPDYQHLPLQKLSEYDHPADEKNAYALKFVEYQITR